MSMAELICGVCGSKYSFVVNSTVKICTSKTEVEIDNSLQKIKAEVAEAYNILRDIYVPDANDNHEYKRGLDKLQQLL